jgi:hypothetical protein
MWRHLPPAYPVKAALPLSSSNNWLHSCRLSIAEKHGANNQQEQSKAPLTVWHEIQTTANTATKSNKYKWETKYGWKDLHDDNKTCMQLSYWELILENGQWLGCWITDGLCALPVTDWTGIHGFGYIFPLIQIAPFSVHKLIEQDTAVLHQAIICIVQLCKCVSLHL